MQSTGTKFGCAWPSDNTQAGKLHPRLAERVLKARRHDPEQPFGRTFKNSFPLPTFSAHLFHLMRSHVTPFESTYSEGREEHPMKVGQQTVQLSAAKPCTVHFVLHAWTTGASRHVQPQMAITVAVECMLFLTLPQWLWDKDKDKERGRGPHHPQFVSIPSQCQRCRPHQERTRRYPPLCSNNS